MLIGVAKECHPLLFACLTEVSLVVPEYDLGLLLEFYRLFLQRFRRCVDFLHPQLDDRRRCLYFICILNGQPHITDSKERQAGRVKACDKRQTQYIMVKDGRSLEIGSR